MEFYFIFPSVSSISVYLYFRLDTSPFNGTGCWFQSWRLSRQEPRDLYKQHSALLCLQILRIPLCSSSCNIYHHLVLRQFWTIWTIIGFNTGYTMMMITINREYLITILMLLAIPCVPTVMYPLLICIITFILYYISTNYIVLIWSPSHHITCI